MKNPDWTRDELILALDLYFKLDYGKMHGRNPKLAELSELLRSLDIHKVIVDKKSFRSVSSVSLKLANFKKFDLNFKGKGMRAVGILDREIWKEFQGNKNKLFKEAESIKNKAIQLTSLTNHLIVIDRDNVDKHILFNLHKYVESNPLIRKRKLDIISIHKIKPVCEVCEFDFFKFYGEMGIESIEFHYNKDIRKCKNLNEIGIDEISLVCSNCHKILDKNFNVLSINELRKIIHNTH